MKFCGIGQGNSLRVTPGSSKFYKDRELDQHAGVKNAFLEWEDHLQFTCEYIFSFTCVVHTVCGV